MKKLWICYRRLTALWTLWISIYAEETNFTYLFCFTIWHCVTRKCKCL